MPALVCSADDGSDGEELRNRNRLQYMDTKRARKLAPDARKMTMLQQKLK